MVSALARPSGRCHAVQRVRALDLTPVRVLTAAALFDGHDAAIHVVRRILQARGAEVIHLGHDRSVAEIVQAAIQEDVQAIALSSYQGGHMESFQYLKKMLKEHGKDVILIDADPDLSLSRLMGIPDLSSIKPMRSDILEFK